MGCSGFAYTDHYDTSADVPDGYMGAHLSLIWLDEQESDTSEVTKMVFDTQGQWHQLTIKEEGPQDGYAIVYIANEASLIFTLMT
ncbi:hypothetical protein V6R21_01365 [Limibacter armeniacum]|uniref:hypothetical protein n=1 Tax=Limibacter armeniacum TaxID=466084 RepID=UPI002FE541A6